MVEEIELFCMICETPLRFDPKTGVYYCPGCAEFDYA